MSGDNCTHIADILKKNRPSFSFEFFPPKTPRGWERLFETINSLLTIDPAYVSVTYGAGGSTRERTHELVMRIKREVGLPVVTHLTCVGSTQDEIGEILRRYHAGGIRNIMALRGDLPAGASGEEVVENGFDHAVNLVRFIKKHFPDMGIGVAGFPEGHPHTPNRLHEIDYLKEKVDAGADYICTQLFFENRDFYDFRDRCEYAGIRVPILAGIMPVTTRSGLIRMAELAAGARIPAPLLKSILDAKDDSEVLEIGVDWGTRQIESLLENDVRGVHFYTLNKSRATLRIYEALKSTMETSATG